MGTEQEWRRRARAFHELYPDKVFPRQLESAKVNDELQEFSNALIQAYVWLRRAREHLDVLAYGTMDTDQEELGEQLSRDRAKIAAAEQLTKRLGDEYSEKVEITDSMHRQLVAQMHALLGGGGSRKGPTGEPRDDDPA